MLSKLIAFAAFLCLSPSLTFTQQNAPDTQPNQFEGVAPRAQELHVKLGGGAIRLEGYSGERIAYLFRQASSSRSPDRPTEGVTLYKVAAYKKGTTSWLVATPASDDSAVQSIELVVRVPREVHSVALETSGGDVTVHDVSSRVELISGGGGLRIDGVRGEVRAETGGQDIDVGTVESDARFRTGGGRISVGYIKGNLDAFTGGGSISLGTGMRNAVLQSGAGDVHVTFCGGELRVQSGGGNLILGEVGGPADIRTNGGNLRLGPAKGYVRAHTSAGNIELQSVPGADASTEVGSIVAKFSPSAKQRRSSLLQSNAGDITVFLPAELAVTVRASVGLGDGHTISSELPGLRVASTEGWSRSILAKGKINGGGPVLDVRAGNGNITFKRLER